MIRKIGGVSTSSLRALARMSAVVAVVVFAPALAGAETPLEVVHTFDAPDQHTPEPPQASVTRTADGSLYVTTAGGGSSERKVVNQGTIFKMDSVGIVTMLHEFSGGADGATPFGALVLASDGNFYGTTYRGGAHGLGTAFRMTPDGALTTLHAFAGGEDGARPKAGLIQATDGNFYGTTFLGGAENVGTVFRMTADGAVTILYAFKPFSSVGDRGQHPQAALLQASDGTFYWTANTSSRAIGGLVFRMTADGAVTFGTVGFPYDVYGPLIQGSDGSLYGTAHSGLDRGEIFRFQFEVGFGWYPQAVYDLGPSGPVGALVRNANGDFYGTTALGGIFGRGTVFKLSAAGVRTTLYSFSATNAFQRPHRTATLVRAPDGTLYGATSGDGPSAIGSVFQVTAAGTGTVLRTFAAGREGSGTLGFQGADGNFYGRSPAAEGVYVESFGAGAFGLGTIFRVTPSGAYSVVHTFAGGATDGANPSSVIEGKDGAFYGTTTAGGAYGKGTVFKLAVGGGATILHSFAGGADGAEGGLLIQASDGNFYGTTNRGGLSDGGTAFRMTADGGVTVLHSFDRGAPGSFLQGADGNFYGTTLEGCDGAVFRMRPDGSAATIFSISTHDNYYYCMGLPGIVRGADGNLYGTTLSSIHGTLGLFYRIGVDSTVTVLRLFDLLRDSVPVGSVVAAADGSFYGSFSGPWPSGGPLYPNGAIFRITADGAMTIVFADSGSADLLQARDGFLYGTIYGSTMFRLPAVVPSRPHDGDLDGDGKADLAVFRPSTGTWYLQSPGGTTTSYTFGGSGDVPVPGDYDGDGTTDIAVFRPSNSTWYMFLSHTKWTRSYFWGAPGDIPVPADYDGDGQTDIAVFRPSTHTWYIVRSSLMTGIAYNWGAAGDIPVPHDYDGDGKSDLAVYRPSTGTWHIVSSKTAIPTAFRWGIPGDVPVARDYDGDGKADIAVFRPSTGAWFIVQSTTSTGLKYTWGGVGDVPVPADYDGDGKTDVAVFRPSTGTWYVINSGTSTATAFAWGGPGDTPISNRQ